MPIRLRNQEPDDPAAIEAATLARDLMKAVVDGDEAFLSIPATEAVSFLGAMPMGKGLGPEIARADLTSGVVATSG